jgi:hypothetical protein
MQDFSSSPLVRRFLVVMAILLVVLAIFTFGVHVGERKARHFSGWERNYQHMVPSRRGPAMMNERTPFMRPPLPGAHGVFGNIPSMTDNHLVIQGQNGIEENVVITSSTVIRVGQDTVNMSDLPANLARGKVAVFGTPTDQGQLEARLIRLFVQP